MNLRKHFDKELAMKTFILASLVFFVLGTQTVFAGTEEKIDFSDILDPVKKVLKKRFEKATLLSANTETEEDGTIVYEIQGKLSDGRSAEFDVFPDGKIEEVEIIFPMEMVPGAITKAINKKMPGFIPTKIEASHSASMKVIRYEFEGTLNDQKMDLEVSADGRTITVADQ